MLLSKILLKWSKGIQQPKKLNLQVRSLFGVVSHMPKIPLDQEFPVVNNSHEHMYSFII